MRFATSLLLALWFFALVLLGINLYYFTCSIFHTGIDDKHGKHFQSQFSLDKYMERICDSAKRESVDPQAYAHCTGLSRSWKNRSGSKVNKGYWKERSIVQSALNQFENKTLEKVGTEKEEIWALLNIQCQHSLIIRCEIPSVCLKTLLDPIPGSQYQLTHQLLHRILIENADCPSAEVKSFVTEEETHSRLCAKMYAEAKYLDILDVPVLHRDLFAELG